MYINPGGRGDNQAADQFSAAFRKFVAENDPGWGDVVIAAGNHGVLHPHRGDINLYWEWSGYERDDWLSYYMDHASVKPSLILCGSWKIYEDAKGFPRLYFPVAAGDEYYPMNLPRSGTGYCGTGGGHKSQHQVDCMIEPAKKYGFTWITTHSDGRSGLNQSYNGWACCLGMNSDNCQRWGVVPIRTYEVLATGSPYITYHNDDLNKTLGFEYPYQSSSAKETEHWLDELINNDHKEEFAKFAEIINREHRWINRIQTLSEAL